MAGNRQPNAAFYLEVISRSLDILEEPDNDDEYTVAERKIALQESREAVAILKQLTRPRQETPQAPPIQTPRSAA